jgi:hypothetical protein
MSVSDTRLCDGSEVELAPRLPVTLQRVNWWPPRRTRVGSVVDRDEIDIGSSHAHVATWPHYGHRSLAAAGQVIRHPVGSSDCAPQSWPPNTTESESAMGLASTTRRLAAALVAVVAMASLAPATAHANAQGARQAAAADCPEGLCVIRATRTWMVRSSSSWNIPAATAAVEWIAVVNDGSGCTSSSCILQQGYGNWIASAEPTSCSNGTGGDVKQFYYSIDASGDATCVIGQLVGSSEGHTQKITRCLGSEWCTYFDGDFKFDYDNTGIGSTAPLAVIAGEFTCNSCQTSSTVMRASYGAGSTSNTNWDISDKGDGTDFTALVNSDTSTSIVASCSGTSNSHWVVDPVSTSSMWDVYWANGGTNC